MTEILHVDYMSTVESADRLMEDLEDDSGGSRNKAMGARQQECMGERCNLPNRGLWLRPRSFHTVTLVAKRVKPCYKLCLYDFARMILSVKMAAQQI